MDQKLRDFQVGAMANAVSVWDHRVIVTTTADTVVPPTTVVLKGVQSDVEVDPQDLVQFGFKINRVFSLTVNDPSIIETIRVGMRAVEQNTGELARFLWHKRDILGTTLYFGSVNK